MSTRMRQVLYHLVITLLLTGCATANRKTEAGTSAVAPVNVGSIGETMPEAWTDNGTLFVQATRRGANPIVVERGVAQSLRMTLDGACLAVTALHVVRDQDTIFAMPWSQHASNRVPSTKATIVQVDERRDLALLKFKLMDFRCPQLESGLLPKTLGTRVHHFSQPLLNYGARFDGFLAANEWPSEQFASNLLIADMTTVYGSSGAVLFDDQHRALGVIVERMDLKGKGMTKVIPIDAANSLIEAYVKSRKEGVGEFQRQPDL